MFSERKYSPSNAFYADAIQATIQLMETKRSKLSVHTAYNIGGFSVTPSQIYEEIKKHIPDFKITYKKDFRQAIADTWPETVDDSVARREWGFTYKYGLKNLTSIMLEEIQKKLKKKN